MAKTIEKSESLQIENLLKAAFQRTKDRFIGWFVINIIAFLAGFVVTFVAVVIGVILWFVFQKNIPFLIFVESILALGLISAIVYTSSWIQLAVVKMLTSEEKKGAIDTIKDVRPLVGGFIGFIVLNSLFLFGLLPFGFLTLFIIYIIWSIWSTFAVFVYMDYQKKGLGNLWLSRSLVNKNFWGIFGRIILISGGLVLITTIISTYAGDNGLVQLLSVILSLVCGPFIMSYTYEIYKHYREDIDVKTPPIWMALSVIGGLMMIFGIVYGAMQIPQQLPTILKQMEQYNPNTAPMPSGIPIPTEYDAT